MRARASSTFPPRRPSPTSTTTATFTPIPATFTPTFTSTATLTPTLVFTPTPLVPMVRVSVATNCRLGPGKAYALVGALLVGETAQVYARSSAGDYWYIRNPDRSTQFCWLWGEYATVTGLYTGLPIYTPRPSPTPTYTATPAPGFDASYQGLQTCSGKWWGDIKLKNTGSATFRSVSMTLRDTVTSKAATTIRDGFTDLTGCGSTSRSTLVPGKSATASSPQFAYNPAGHKLKLTITLCTNTGLNGLCVTETITFKP